jgi:1,4-dihydroxy-2-naphthoate octaprenyltransferase
MNASMWLKALRVIPRLSKEEWIKLDLIARWLVATRAAVLIMTFVSATIPALLALRDGNFNAGRYVLLVFGLLFAHATNNLLNDYTDFKRGVDKDNYFRTQYGPQPLESGLMSERELLTYAAITGALAVAAGVPLVIYGGVTALLLMLAGIIFVLFYTWPLKYVGLGELAVILIWGPLMVGGGYFVITGHWDWNVALASLPYALGPTTVIFGKHIDKLAQDQVKGIRTLPVVLGEKAARYVVMGMIVLQYVLVLALIVSGYFSPLMLVVLVGLKNVPAVFKMLRTPRPTERPADYPQDAWPLWFSAAAFLQNRLYGLMFLLGLILSLFIKI